MRQNLRRTLLVGVVGLAAFLGAVSPASASVALSVVPAFPNATVGQTGVAGTLEITNVSTPPQSTGNLTVNSINLVPACGTSTPVGSGDCPAGPADAGVFHVSSTGTGEFGTACETTTFTISTLDMTTGQLLLTPSGGGLILGSPSSTGLSPTCRIHFTFDVLKAPTKAAGPSPPNTVKTDQIGFASATAADTTTGSSVGTSSAVVTKAQPGISTSATSSAAMGAQIADSATLSAASPPGPAPIGTITFSLFTTAGCTGTPVFTSTKSVNSGTGTYQSAQFTPTAPGTYRWVASYSGDANNVAVAGGCGDAGETTTVRASPALATTASAPVALGGAISDSATLSGGTTPTGTITFDAYGPDNATCTGTPAFTAATPVSGNGDSGSGPFTPTAAGTYRWVASYSGDANNSAAQTACGDAGEAVTVSPAAGKTVTTLVTKASPGVSLGNAVSDTATLSGGGMPTGTISFQLFGPDDPTCAAAAVFTSARDVTFGNGNYSSELFEPTAAGTYRWVASYGGDAGNAPSSSACSDQAESVTVTGPAPVPTPPSSEFSITSRKVTKNAHVAVAVATHAPGALSGKATFSQTIKHKVGQGPKRHTVTTRKTITFATATKSVPASHAVTITLKPTARARALLKRFKRLSVKVALTFKATGATGSVTHRKTVTVKVR